MRKDHTQFAKAMFTDTDELRQPENTYRFLQNGVLESKSGDYGDVINERGTDVCATLPEGYTVLGSAVNSNNEIIMLLSDGSTTIIGKQTRDCKFVTYVESTCLGLDPKYPVDVTYRVREGCNNNIYFTDGFNPPYAIDLDTLQDFVETSLSDQVDADDTITDKSGEKVRLANLNDRWDCNKFRIFADINIPRLYVESVSNSGGRLLVGSYRFSIRYLDEDLNPTNWFYITAPNVPVTFDPTTLGYDTIQGGFNGSGTGDDGYNTLAPTSKSINLRVENLDDTYAYYQIAAIEYVDGIGVVSNVYVLDEKPIAGDEDFFTYTGVDPTANQTSTTIGELIVPRLVVNTAKHVNQIDNRLLLSNGTGKTVNWAKFQQKANNITSKYVVKRVKKKDSEGDVKSPEYYINHASYMRDEVYAYGVVWIFNDGEESPAIHIPGRKKDVISTILGNNQSYNGEDSRHTRPKADKDKWDSTIISDTLDDSEGIAKCTEVVNITNPSTVTLSITADRSYTFNDTTDAYNVYLTINASVTGGTVKSGTLKFANGNSVEIRNGLETGAILVGSENNQPTTDLSYNLSIEIQLENDARYSKDFNLLYGRYDSSVSRSLELDYDGAFTVKDLERWQVYNTALKDDAAEDGFFSSGEMSYYECCTKYPDVLDCEGNRIYPTGNIRHHKFPDTILEPHHDESYIYPIGIKFDNIEPPEEYADQVQGYYIVRVRRDEVNKTIVDKGFIDRAEYYNNNPEDDTNTNGYYSYTKSGTVLDNSGYGTSDKVFVFHSSRTYFNRDFLGGTHVKFEQSYEYAGGSNSATPLVSPYSVYDGDCDMGASGGSILYYNLRDNGQLPPQNQTNRSIEGTTYVDVTDGKVENLYLSTTTLAEKRVVNNISSNHLYFGRVEDTFDNNYMYYGSVKTFNDVYCNLNGLKYYKAHSFPFNSTEKSNAIFGGDTFITRLAISLQDKDNSRAFLWGYVESEINADLRNSGGSPESEHWNGGYNFDRNNPLPGESPVSVKTADQINMCLWMKRFERRDEDYENSGFRPDGWVYEDPWFYNKDYNINIYEREYFPISTRFDYCKKCLETFPHRIWYSEKSLQEQRADGYKNFLGLNYRDLLAEHGELTNLFVDKDRLYAHTDKALWFVPTRPQQLQTNESTLFVQSGDFLSIAPKRLVSTDYGYGGSTNKWSTIVTEFGTLFIDSRMGKVFLMREGLQEISQDGMRNWFENNLTIEFLKDWPDYPYNSTHHKNGVGFIATYDPRYRRIIIHKRDFKILDKDIATYTVEGSKILRNGSEVDLSDKRYFENKSWTISYSLVHKAWASFHSYMPLYMYNDADVFYSVVKDDNKTWSHDSENYQTYYGTKHDFVVDYIYNPNYGTEKIFNSIQYISKVTSYDNITKNPVLKRDVTFNKMIVYNNDQSSGLTSLVVPSGPYDSINWTRGQALVKRTDNYWRINRLSDTSFNRNDESMFTSQWSEIQNDFDVDGKGNGYIDRKPNPTAINDNKDVYQLSRFRDKWLGVRLFFTQPEGQNLKISLQISSLLNTISKR